MAYLGGLSTQYHDHIPINAQRFTDLLVLLVKKYLASASDFPQMQDAEAQEAALRALL